MRKLVYGAVVAVVAVVGYVAGHVAAQPAWHATLDNGQTCKVVDVSHVNGYTELFCK